MGKPLASMRETGSSRPVRETRSPRTVRETGFCRTVREHGAPRSKLVEEVIYAPCARTTPRARELRPVREN